MQRTRSIVLGVGLVGLLALCGTALGQNAIGDGRALDRNLQRGSGGVNTKVRDLDAQIKLNNAIVTGNAAYGRSFRGNVGYLATDDFRAGLGSNDLFRSQRDLAGSAALAGVATVGGSGLFNSVDPAESGAVRFTQRGIRGTDALRYQMALTTGTASPGEAGEASLIVRRSGAGASAQSIGNAMRSTSEFRTQRSSQPTVLGTEVGTDGHQYALLASPLMGVKVREMESDTGPTGPNEPGKWRPTGVESQARMARERIAGTGDGRPKAPPPTAVSTRVDTEVGALGGVLERFQAESQARAGANEPLDTTDRPGATRPGDRTVPVDTQPGAKPAPGEAGEPFAPTPAWLTSLEDMRRSLRGEPSRREAKPDADKPATDQPDNGRPDNGRPDANNPAQPKPERIPVTPEDRRIQLDARVKAILDAQGFAEQDAFSVDQIAAAKKARMKVNTMIAGKPASVYYIERMVDGERALREERYFDAEDAFSRALGASSRDALAQAGRAHAQIGAGLYMSAAANLRDLFATRPEMIGVKFDAGLMPASERLKTIREQLAKAAARRDSTLSGDAGLLLAYLAYQAGDLEGVDAGLRAFGAKIEPDNAADLALLELAAKVWKEPVPADLPVLEKATDPAAAPIPAGALGNPDK